jgi:hypothetical protein
MEADAATFQSMAEYYRRAVEGHVYVQSTFDLL